MFSAFPRAPLQGAFHTRGFLRVTTSLAGLLIVLTAGPVRAQGWFTPTQPAQKTQAAAPAPHAASPRQASRPPQMMQDSQQGMAQPGMGDEQQGADAGPQPLLPQPPVPELPPLAKGVPPPAAVIGVLGVPDIMQDSTAARQVQKEIGGRREKLNADAQKEQQTWRDMGQALQADRARLPPDQIRTRERELQERVTNAQKQLRDRNRIIQEAAQVGLGQIERTLIGIIRQVADSRGMNLVLHRNQVALNVNEFDISRAVVEQLNKVLPAVMIPPDGVDPATMVTSQFSAPAASAAASPAPGAPAVAAPAAAAAPTAAAAASPATPAASAGQPAPALPTAAAKH